MTKKINVFIEGNISLPYKGLKKNNILLIFEKILEILQIRDSGVSLIICNNDYIKKINKLYRHKNKATDVISFAYNEAPFPSPALNTNPLGDIYISLEKASENAPSYGNDLHSEFKRLTVHGILHLLGYDHELSAYRENKMRKKENEILQLIND